MKKRRNKLAPSQPPTTNQQTDSTNTTNTKNDHDNAQAESIKTNHTKNDLDNAQDLPSDGDLLGLDTLRRSLSTAMDTAVFEETPRSNETTTETIDSSAQTPDKPDEPSEQDNTETTEYWEQSDVLHDHSNQQTPMVATNATTNTPIPNFGGETFSYFFICKRKCWLHHHRIHLQQESEAVALGKLLHLISFPREKQKEFAIEGAKIDFLDKTSIVHEIKSSDRFEDAHIEQVKFYLYLLFLRGFPEPKGRIHYPKLKKTVDVDFTKEDLQRISQQIQEIQAFLLLEKPPKQPHAPLCKKCSYEEFCWG